MVFKGGDVGMEVMSITKAAEKLVRRGAMAGDDYKVGCETTRKDQAESAIAAKDNYVAALTESFARGAFEKGLTKSGHAKWRAKATTKGAVNYPTAMRLAGSDYASGVEPYFRALESLTLPPKGTRGSPGNLERVRVLTEALHAVRMGM